MNTAIGCRAFRGGVLGEFVGVYRSPLPVLLQCVVGGAAVVVVQTDKAVHGLTGGQHGAMTQAPRGGEECGGPRERPRPHTDRKQAKAHTTQHVQTQTDHRQRVKQE
uniref:Uncharacterized protein n=1 Tax=Knipowitschia caucasica TaxID=637954 RepID=A0AAV2M031_KNICA